VLNTVLAGLQTKEKSVLVGEGMAAEKSVEKAVRWWKRWKG
jgi:hypothetical protein